MAKKRKAKEERKEEPEFEFPEFDEVKFMSHEIRDTKANFIAFGFAMLMVLASYLVGRYISFAVAFIIGLFGMAALKFVFDGIKLDLEEFGKKEWLGVIAVYFFSWLAIWILISNPPISDFASPEIRIISDPVQEPKMIDVQNSTFDQVAIEIKIIDNYRVTSTEIEFQDYPPAFTPGRELQKTGRNMYTFRSDTWALGEYEYSIRAKDTFGNEKIIKNQHLQIINASIPEVSVQYQTGDIEITVWVSEPGHLNRVWYVDNSTQETQDVKWKQTVEARYKAEISIEGWTGKHEFTFYAEDNAGNRGSATFTWPVSD